MFVHRIPQFWRVKFGRGKNYPIFLGVIITAPFIGKITHNIGVYVCPQNSTIFNWGKIWRGFVKFVEERANFDTVPNSSGTV